MSTALKAFFWAGTAMAFLVVIITMITGYPSPGRLLAYGLFGVVVGIPVGMYLVRR